MGKSSDEQLEVMVKTWVLTAFKNSNNKKYTLYRSQKTEEKNFLRIANCGLIHILER